VRLLWRWAALTATVLSPLEVIVVLMVEGVVQGTSATARQLTVSLAPCWFASRVVGPTSDFSWKFKVCGLPADTPIAQPRFRPFS
jgi:hypothetical protein